MRKLFRTLTLTGLIAVLSGLAIILYNLYSWGCSTADRKAAVVKTETAIVTQNALQDNAIGKIETKVNNLETMAIKNEIDHGVVNSKLDGIVRTQDLILKALIPAAKVHNGRAVATGE